MSKSFTGFRKGLHTKNQHILHPPLPFFYCKAAHCENIHILWVMNRTD